MSIMSMYTTTCTRLVHTNSLVLLRLVALFFVFYVRLVPLGFIRLITLVTLVTLVTLLLIPFLQTLRIGHTLLCIDLTLRGGGFWGGGCMGGSDANA